MASNDKRAASGQMASNDERAASITTGGKRKRTSNVWQSFSYLPSSVPGEADKAQCRSCGAVLTAGNGTSHLKRHIDCAKCKNTAAAVIFGLLHELYPMEDAVAPGLEASSVTPGSSFRLDADE